MTNEVDSVLRLRRQENFQGNLNLGTDLNGVPTHFTFHSVYTPSTNANRPVRGRNGRASYDILCQGFDGGSFTQGIVAEGTATFDGDGALVISEVVTPDRPCEFASITVDPSGNMRFTEPGTQLQEFGAYPLGAGACTPGPNTLCLQDDRFQVEVDWRSSRQSGAAVALPQADSEGFFYFFDPDNTELVVKVLDACDSNFNRFWVFAGGLTNVEVDISVTDTQTGTTRTYSNPLGTPFQPIQDTNAFATCP